MFEFLTPNSDDAVSILKHDHQKVKDLFDQFEKTDSLREKRKIVAQAIMELKIHAAIEEDIFYPAVRKPIGKKIMNEADEEHHVAKLLIAELELMDGKEDHYDAKFKVLAENIRHHIKEEERDMLPKAAALDIDMDALGRILLARKQQLLKNGVATFAEEKLMASRKGRSDSPARAAKRTAPKIKAKPPAAKAKKPAKPALKRASGKR